MTTYQEKKHPHGRVETDMTKNNEDEFVYFYPQGGGFRCQLPHAKFHEVFELATGERPWRRGYVDADWTEGMGPDGTFLMYPCWSNGDRWNGWGSPYFERATAELIVQHQAQHGDGVNPLRWEGDNVVEGPSDPAYPDEFGVYEPMTLPNGVMVWGIGAGSWCWNSVTTVPTVEETAARIERDIVAMIKEGAMPRGVSSLEDVHDHCDGNCLGGLCEDDLFDTLVLHYGGRDEHEGMPQGMINHINQANDQVEIWLAAGGHLEETK
jgi:hypothetical protein